MLLDRLDYVIAVAEAQNLTRAAEQLHISQPALTLYLNRLEAQLGVKLFDRAKNPILLTDAGRYYLDEMKKVRAATQSIRQDLQAIADPARTLRLGIGQVRGSHWLPILLPAFCQKYPNVNVHVIQSTESRMEELLRQNRIDLIFGAMSLSPGPQYQVIKLFSSPEPLLLAVHRSFGLVPAEVRDQYSYHHPYIIQPQVLDGLPFIIPNVDNGLYEPFRTLLDENNLRLARTVTVNNMLTGLQLTSQGLGVQLIYTSGIRFNAVSGIEDVDFCILEHMPAGHSCVAVYRSNNIKTESIQAMIHIAEEQIVPLVTSHVVP